MALLWMHSISTRSQITLMGCSSHRVAPPPSCNPNQGFSSFLSQASQGKLALQIWQMCRLRLRTAFPHRRPKTSPYLPTPSSTHVKRTPEDVDASHNHWGSSLYGDAPDAVKSGKVQVTAPRRKDILGCPPGCVQRIRPIVCVCVCVVSIGHESMLLGVACNRKWI